MMSIPKIIHQTYKTCHLPKELAEITESLRRLNPDWEYKFYTDEDILNYIKQHFDESILNAYLSINPVLGAAKADLFRYLAVYNEGGVYLDIKSTCIYPLSSIIQADTCFITAQRQNEIGQDYEGVGKMGYIVKDLGISHGEYQQWFIIAEKNSPILKKMIEEFINNINTYTPWKYKFNGYGKRGVLFVTGPVVYTQVIHEMKHLYPIQFFRYDKDIGLKYNAIKNNQSHTKVLKNHYSKYKTYVVDKGPLMNIIFYAYIIPMRLFKNTLKIFNIHVD